MESIRPSTGQVKILFPMRTMFRVDIQWMVSLGLPLRKITSDPPIFPERISPTTIYEHSMLQPESMEGRAGNPGPWYPIWEELTMTTKINICSPVPYEETVLPGSAGKTAGGFSPRAR